MIRLSKRKKDQLNQKTVLYSFFCALLLFILGFLYVSNEVENSYHSKDTEDKLYIYYIWAGGSYETDFVFWTVELKYSGFSDLWKLQNLELNQSYHYVLLILCAGLNAVLTKRLENGILFGIFFALLFLMSGYIGIGALAGDRDNYEMLTTETILNGFLIPIAAGFVFALVFYLKK